ncbi:MAG: RHS repeat protein, partial [Chloroflexi bacterium]|nr:RHS repeat protein [Chloroflexota bacterium]
HQYNGSYSNDPDWSANQYVTANYEYDELDQLTDVYGPDNSGYATEHTEISYDALGRKTGVNDPNMGVWSYEYDDAGNLTVQTDAEGQSICFFYDELSRVKGKTYVESPTTCPITDPGYGNYVVGYTYDNNDWGIGRRTGMEDTSGTGSTQWRYDERGRLTQEDKVIDNSDPYVTQYSYDSLDRVETMTYPDGEVLTYSYNAQGLNNALQTDVGADYVTSTSYDEAGRVDVRTLGANLSSDYSYYAWDSNPGRGRLHTILSKNSSSGE